MSLMVMEMSETGTHTNEGKLKMGSFFKGKQKHLVDVFLASDATIMVTC